MTGDNRDVILGFKTQDNHKILNNKGVSLLEIIISVSVFVVVIMLATSIFQSVVEGQRQAISSQHTQESIRYVMEVISKDIRQAIRDDDDSCGVYYTNINRIFNQNGSDTLYFENKHHECVQYYLDGSSLMKSRDGVTASTTPDEIEVSNLAFIVKPNAVGVSPANRIQQIVTMKMKVEGSSAKATAKVPFYIQTSVSSRFYE